MTLAPRRGIGGGIGQEIEPAGGTAMDELAGAPVDGRLDEVGIADEIGDEPVDRLLVDFDGRAQLLDLALAHDRDAVAHGERLFLVMGDEDEGDAGAPLQVLQFAAHLLAKLQVEGGQGLVQQQHVGMVGERPGERHALLLAARKLGRPAPAQPRHLDQRQHLLDDALHLLLGAAAHFQPEGDVLGDRHMGKQGVALEHGVDGALIGRQMLDRLAFEENFAGRRLLEAGDEAQKCRLAAARGAEKGEEFVLLDGDGNFVQGPYAVLALPEDLGHAARFDRCDIRQNGDLPIVSLPNRAAI